MRKIVSLFLALCLVLGMASVAAADDEFVLNLCIASEPETIDPNLGSSVDSAIYANHQFENLMKYAMTDEQFAYLHEFLQFFAEFADVVLDAGYEICLDCIPVATEPVDRTLVGLNAFMSCLHGGYYTI